MDVLLTASLVLFAAGAGLIITGRWQAVSRSDSGAPDARAWTPTSSIGLAAASAGALLLIAFVAISMSMPNAVAA